MKGIIYLDNSATTKPCDACIEAVNTALCLNWGNPSSLHTLGISAEEILLSAQETCAAHLSARPDEIFFTSGGTESNNIAINGAVSSRAKRGNRIVTTAIEHPSVLETVKSFEDKGFEVIRLVPDKSGVIKEDDLCEAITKNTILVSIMLVNNEIGSVQPIKAARRAINACGCPAVLHCDAVQAFGKMPINVNELDVDLLSASGHKIHGPKGIGILYKKKGLHIPALTFGGGQQNALRPGTEPTPLIAGLEAAVKNIGDEKKNLEVMKNLCDYAKDKLTSVDGIKINSPELALPYILNISVEGYRSETLLHFLDAKGILVSSGSACAKGDLSYTLSALGLNKSRIDSALRISFSKYNSKEEVDRLCTALIEAKQKLKRAKQ